MAPRARHGGVHARLREGRADVVSDDLEKFIHDAIRNGRGMDPNNARDRKLILAQNLRSMARDLEGGVTELVFSDSHGILTPTGEQDVFVFAIHQRVRTPDPERCKRIVAALAAAFVEVRRIP